jgi:glyoxylate utilization-related uncharacterized protein
MADYVVKHDEELKRDYDIWVLVRASLGVGSFGLNLVELPPGKDIPEHDELDRDQEEVFYVVAGAPTMVVDGQEHPLRQGSWVRVGPAPKRTVRNDTDEPAEVMIISAPTTSGYEPMSWA